MTRYTGNYDKFQELYQIHKAQLEAAYDRQQQEVARLEDFIARNKARVATTGMARSRQRKLDKMELIERPAERPKPHFRFQPGRTPGRFLAEAENLVLGYDTPLTRPVSFNWKETKSRGQGRKRTGKNYTVENNFGRDQAPERKNHTGGFSATGLFRPGRTGEK